MKVIKMLSYKDADKYPDWRKQENRDDFWEFVKKYLVENNIKMCGRAHQFFGVPIIEDKGKIYAFALSCGGWGQLMAEAFEPKSKDKMAYCKWAWYAPDGDVSWENPDYIKIEKGIYHKDEDEEDYKKYITYIDSINNKEFIAYMGCKDFDDFKWNICDVLGGMDDLSFLLIIIKKDVIRYCYDNNHLPECFYLLGMVDYLCRVNNLSLDENYNHLRKQKLENLVYPMGVCSKCERVGNDEPKEEALKEAIPEFLRFNIVEDEDNVRKYDEEAVLMETFEKYKDDNEDVLKQKLREILHRKSNIL